jgi:hypothetical protein
MVDPAGKAQGLGIDNFSFAASDQPIGNPVALTVSMEATNLTFNWPALVGQAYQAEYNDDLGTTNWIPLGPPIDALSRVGVITNPITSSNRFFRLRLVLP